MLIMGVDPGLANSGFGVVKSEGRTLSLVEYGTIVSAASEAFPERLLKIHNEFLALLETYRPDVCAVEAIFFAKNAKSAFQVGHARAVFILTAAMRDIQVFEYTPLQIKKALVGVGRAEKEQVQYMTKVLLGLKQVPEPDHAADAVAVAICHANSMKMSALAGVSRAVYGKQYRDGGR